MENPIIFTETYHSPCGDLILGSFGDQLCLCDWLNSKQRQPNRPATALCTESKDEGRVFSCYPQGRQRVGRVFPWSSKVIRPSVVVRRHSFPEKVWKTLLRVPYGEIRTYAWMAKEMGNERAVRAVGHADGCNPIVIFASLSPCRGC